MQNTNDFKRRSEIVERVDILKTDISESESDMEIIAKDVEVIKNTLKKLDFGSTTSEGYEEINNHIDAAEDITKEEFRKEDDLLEKKQDNSAVLEKNLSNRNESSEKNIDKVSGVEGAIKTKETSNELNKAKNAALKDMEFLITQIDRARREREKSEKIQRQLQAKVQ